MISCYSIGDKWGESMKKLLKSIFIFVFLFSFNIYSLNAKRENIEKAESSKVIEIDTDKEEVDYEEDEEELEEEHLGGEEPICEVSEAYLEWLNLPDEERNKYIMPERCELDEEDSEGIISLDRATNYPSYYLSKSTAVKNQGSTGTCWAFASTTVLESYWLNKSGQTLTLSPGHLNYMESQSFYDTVNKHGNVRWVNDGGHLDTTSTYLINRYGPVLESTVPTINDVSELQPVAYNTIWGKKNVLDVNNIQYSYRTKLISCTSTDKNRIKNNVVKYGPVGVYLHLLQYNINTKYNSYIFKTNKKIGINHVVTIVGWDDNYPAYKFDGKAKNNGAWIVQNSWGEYSGDNGLLYVSYEDDTICTRLFSVRSADTNFSDNKYITSERTWDGWANNTTEMTVFNKKNNGVAEKLNKVSFQTMGATKYKVYYYKGNAAKKKIKTSKMTLIASGTANYTGWVTIKPKKTITIPAGTKQYSIVVVLSNKKIALTYNKTYSTDPKTKKPKLYASPDKFKKGFSYVYYGGKWRDFYSFYRNGKSKATINAFTDNITLNIEKPSVKYYKEDYFNVFFDVNVKYNTKITKVDFIKDGNSVFTAEVDISLNKGDYKQYYFPVENLSNFKNGTYTLRVHCDNGTIRTKNIKVNVIPISGVKITNKAGIKLGVGKTLQMTYTLSPSNFNSINPTIKWSSSNTSIASVDENGIVTGVNTGNVTITATTMNNKTSSYDLIIDRPIESIYLSKNAITLDVGESYTATASVRPRNTTDDKTLIWYASDYRALVTTPGGVITAYKPGKTRIYIEASNGVTAYIDVSVVGVALKEDNISLELGDQYDSEPVVISKSSGVSQAVTLVSSNPKVVSVVNNRTLVANGLGTATITVKDMYGRENYSTVTVNKISASRFTVNTISNKTYNGKSIKPSIKVAYNGVTLKNKKDYTFSYSNNKYPGKATITIKAKSTSSKYRGVKKVYFIIKPKKESITKLTTSSKKIKVVYSKQSHVSGYQIAYRIKGSSTWKSLFVTSNSKKITKLTKKKYYQVKVRSYKKIDGTNYYGAWSKVKTIKCK